MKQIEPTNYRLGKVLTKDDMTSVNAAVQIIADHLERPVVIKIVKHPESLAGDKITEHTQQLEQILKFSRAATINPLYDFGQINDREYWLIFEAPANNLASAITASPASPILVRQVMEQILCALAELHHANPPRIYGVVSPENIVLMGNRNWALNAANIAFAPRSTAASDNVLLKYFAPEQLDAEQGEISPQCDLYALGIALYELALGKKLFHQQFSIVYNALRGIEPNERESTTREKWLYWQTSSKLTVPPISESIPDFPADLSAGIARLMRKNPREREASAAVALEKINWHDTAAVLLTTTKKEEKKPPLLTPLVKVLLIIIAAALLIGGGLLAQKLLGERSIQFQLKQTVYTTTNKVAIVRGRIKNFPAGGELTINVRHVSGIGRSAVIAVVDTGTGEFFAQVPLATYGNYIGVCSIKSAAGTVLMQNIFSLRRDAPEMVSVDFVLSPPIGGVRITVVGLVRDESGGDKFIDHETDYHDSRMTAYDGKTQLRIPYGRYAVKIDDPAFLPYNNTFYTGTEKNTLNKIYLTPQTVNNAAVFAWAPVQSIQLEKQLTDRLKELEAKGEENLIPAEKAELAVVRARLQNLQNMEDAKLSSAQQEQLKSQLTDRLKELEAKGEENLTPAEKAELAVVRARLQNLQNMEDAKLSSAQQEQLKSQLTDRLKELEAKGEENLTPAEKAELAAVRARLQNLRELGETAQNTELAQNRYAEGIIPLSIEQIASMPLAQLLPFVRRAMPTRAINVSINALTNQIQVAGAVLDDKSQAALIARLLPLGDRVMINIDIDPNFVVNSLQADLRAENLAAQVHPFLLQPHHRLLIGLPEQYTDDDKNKIEQIAAGYVITPAYLEINYFPRGDNSPSPKK